MWQSIGYRYRPFRYKKKLTDKYRITDQSSEDSKWSARLRFHFNIEPDELTEEDFIKNVERLRFCLLERGELTIK